MSEIQISIVVHLTYFVLSHIAYSSLGLILKLYYHLSEEAGLQHHAHIVHDANIISMKLMSS